MNLCLLLLFLTLMFITIISSYENKSKKSDQPTNKVLLRGSLKKGKKIRVKRIKKQKENLTEQQPKLVNIANQHPINSRRVGKRLLRKRRKKIAMIANDQPIISSPPKKPGGYKRLVKKQKRRKVDKKATQNQLGDQVKTNANRKKKTTKRNGRKRKINDAPSHQYRRRKLEKDENGYVDIFSEANTAIINENMLSDFIQKHHPDEVKKSKQRQDAKKKINGQNTNQKKKHRTEQRLHWKNKKKSNISGSATDLKKTRQSKSNVNNEVLMTQGSKYEKQKRSDKTEVIEKVAVSTKSPTSINTHQPPVNEKINQNITLVDSFFGLYQYSNDPFLKQPGVKIVKPWEVGEKHVDDDGTVYVIDDRGTVYWGENFGNAASSVAGYRQAKKNMQKSYERRLKELETQTESTGDSREFAKHPLEGCRPLNNGKCRQWTEDPSTCTVYYKDGNCKKGIAYFFIIDMKTGEVEKVQPEPVTFPWPYWWHPRFGEEGP